MELAEPTKKSLLLELYREDKCKKDNFLAPATGFVIKKDSSYYLVTNKHVFTGTHIETGVVKGIPTKVIINHHKKDHIGKWVKKSENLFSEEGEKLWLEHPKFSEKIDVAALKLNNLEGVDCYTYFNGDEPKINISPAEPVSIIGFPFGLKSKSKFPIWKTGFIATDINLDYSNLPVFLVDATTREGQSGSPVIAYRGSGAVSMEDGGWKFYSLRE